MTNNFKNEILSELERIKCVVPRNVEEDKWYEACDKAIKHIEQLKEPDESNEDNMNPKYSERENTISKLTMTNNFKNFKKGFDNFMQAMNEYDKKLVTTDGQILFDKDTLECEETESKDNIVSPNHYISDNGIEVFDVQEAFIHELKGMSASYWCNIVKYILRFQRKNGVEDLKKAKYYLDKLIEEESNNE